MSIPDALYDNRHGVFAVATHAVTGFLALASHSIREKAIGLVLGSLSGAIGRPLAKKVEVLAGTNDRNASFAAQTAVFAGSYFFGVAATVFTIALPDIVGDQPAGCIYGAALAAPLAPKIIDQCERLCDCLGI